MDKVFLHGIRTELAVGVDAWHRQNKPQPVVINIELIPIDTLEPAANDDNVALTLDYGKLYKSLTKSLTNQNYNSIQQLFLSIQESLPPNKGSSIEIQLPKAILLADEGISVTRSSVYSDETGPAIYQRLELKKIQCKCIVGVNPHERLEKQRLTVTVSAESVQTPLSSGVLAGISLEASLAPSYQDAVKDVVERVEGSSYQTVETLATAVAQVVTMNHGFENATVRIEKPSAIAPIEAAGVQITRTRTFFEGKDFWKIKRP